MYIEFLFRIKGSHYYSAEALIESKKLFTNQILKIKPEPSNLFDKNALQIWLESSGLPTRLQKSLTFRCQHLDHPPLTPPVYSTQKTQLVSNLSNELSTLIAQPPRLNRCSNLPTQKYNDLLWHYQAHHWLLGYIPRYLAKPLSPLFKSGTTLYRIKLEKIASQQKLFARLDIQCSIFQSARLLFHLLNKRHLADYQWAFKWYPTNNLRADA